MTTPALVTMVVLAVILGNSIAWSADSAPRPNIVLIYADDLGYGDLPCYGANDIGAPHLDTLAKTGTRFTSFLVAQPVCTASRAGLLTGCYPNRVGMAGALNHTSTVGLNPSERLLSELLKDQGYATAIYGKWHLGHQPAFLPTRQGFDEFVGLPYSNDNGPLHPVTRGIPPLPWYVNEDVQFCDPPQAQFTRTLTERAESFIEKNRDKPFFLYVPHVMPHVPIFVSEQFVGGQNERGPYGPVIQELDWSVGRILAALDKHGLTDRTLVIFASDNGPFLSYGEHAGSAGPLREGKLTTFEGGVRVPCLMRWPGRVPAGRVCNDLCTTLDLYVSLAKLCGAELPKTRIDGVDLRPLLLGEAGAKGRDTFWYYSGDELHAVRQGDWKLHVPHEYLTVAAEPGRGGKPSNYGKLQPQSIELSGIRGIASRHGYRVESQPLALYDLARDPGEARNVAAEHPEIVARLQRVVDEARDDLGDSLTKRPSQNLRAAGEAQRPPPAGVKRLANLEYARPKMKSQGVEIERALLLDLYLPEKPAEAPLPVVLWVHGGGWSKGSKLNAPLAWLAAEGFAVASIDYRLTPEAIWPAQIDDCRAAVRWLRSNAGKYGLSDRIAVAGGSAGGHLAALLGTADAPAGETISSRVQAVGDWYGPSDLLTMPSNVPGEGKTDADLAKSNGAKLLGGAVRDRAELARASSALHQVSASDPPFLIIHGDADKLVPLDQSQRLHAKLQEAGVPSKLHVITGGGHGGAGFDTPEVRSLTLKFFREALAAPVAR